MRPESPRISIGPLPRHTSRTKKHLGAKGLAAIQRLLKESGDQPVAVLTKLAKNEKNPQTEAEKFFTQLKETTAFAYYSSSIGIHQEMGYLGNVLLPQFKGYEAN